MDPHKRNPAHTLEMLATMLDAGVGISAVPELSFLVEPASSQHVTIPDRLMQRGVVDRRDGQLLRFADASGRLPEFLLRVSRRMVRRAAERRKLFVRLAYPAFLVVIAPMLLSLPLWVIEGVGAWMRVALPLPFLFLCGALTAAFAWKRASVESRRVLFDRLSRVPVLGLPFARQRRAEELRLVGLGIETGRSPFEILAVVGLSANGMRGRGWTDSLCSAGLLRPLDVGRVRGAEQSGRLDEVIARIADEQEEEAHRSLVVLGGILAAVVAAFVIATLAYSIVRAGTDAFRTIERDLDGIHRDQAL
jgi:type II secretory pathway component PulF